MRIGIFVSGSVPVQAFRSSANVAGVRDGVAAANADGSRPAAVKSVGQLTAAAGAIAAGSTCGGAASKRSSRPLVSRMLAVMPLNCSGGSARLTGLFLATGRRGRGLVRYQ